MSTTTESGAPNDGVQFIKRLIGAWDCCGTCAGGVLAARDRAANERYERLRARVEELADEWESDADEHMSAFGQHLPGSVSRMAELMRERLLDEA